MRSPLLELASAVVRLWTRLYTWRMPPALRDARRAEIESDLWEFREEPAGRGSLMPAVQVLARMIIGVPDDLGWRVDQAVLGDKPPRRIVALTATAAGGVLFLLALWVISSDARRQNTTSVANSATPAVVEQELREVMRTDVPDSLRKLRTGILAVVAPVMAGVLYDVPLQAQSSAAASAAPAFEAASIKENKSGQVVLRMAPQAGGRFTTINAPTRALILYAYDLPSVQVVGGPDWLTADRFDIVAKAEGDASPGEMRAMLRTLLTERFKLRVHKEARELPVYVMAMTRSDGRIGPQLRRTKADCEHAAPARETSAPSPFYPSGPPSCDFIGPAPGSDFPSGRAHMAFRGVTMERFGRFLAGPLRRYVIDRTGLSGYFDGDFDITAEFPPPPPPPGLPDPFDRQSFPSMFTILPEQLGLKLESTRAPVEVLVIESAEKPTAD